MADPIQGFHLVANGDIEMSPPHHVLPEKPLGWQWALHLCGDSSLFGEEELCQEGSFVVWLTAASRSYRWKKDKGGACPGPATAGHSLLPADLTFSPAEVPLLRLLGSRTTDPRQKSWGLHRAPQDETTWYHEGPVVSLADQTGSILLPPLRARAFHQACGP